MTNSLLSLVPDHLKELNAFEEDLLRRNAYVVMSRNEVDMERLIREDAWVKDGFTIRAELIQWLCTDEEATKFYRKKGVYVVGAQILGDLDLEFAKIPVSLGLFDCYIPASIILVEAEAVRIAFSGSWTGPIFGAGLRVISSLQLRDGFHSTGVVELQDSTIVGEFDVSGASLNNHGGVALRASGIKIGHCALMDELHADGEVNFIGAQIDGTWSMQNAVFTNTGATSFRGDLMTVKYLAALNGITSKGCFSLSQAKFGSNIECDGGTFENPNGRSFNGTKMEVNGSVRLKDGFTSLGELDLQVATLAELDLDGGTFINEEGIAIRADNCMITGIIFFSEGAVRGTFRMISATVSGGFQCVNSKIEGLILQNSKIGDVFFLKLKEPAIAIDLHGVKVDQLNDSMVSWPRNNTLNLHGFEYSMFAEDHDDNVVDRLNWIDLQPHHPFFSQPYEQLAKVFAKEGRGEDAREVLIAKEVAYRKYGQHGFFTKIWLWVLYITIANGYKPWRISWLMLLMILMGTIVFSSAHMEPIKDHAELLSPLNPLVYSLELFIPLVNFHQVEYWFPDFATNGNWPRIYMWFHIALGWTSSTLLAASLTGLIRKH